jgi:drug/metabolite transporter (DMT)-like permease
MQALFLGFVAALAWGFHDFSVRFVSQRTSIPSALLTVLASGAVLVGAITMFLGDWSTLSATAAGLSALSGLAYAAGSYALYRAFADGPVKLVAPLIGAYPVLSVAMAMLQGQAIGPGHWIAVFVIVGGVSGVALFSSISEEAPIRLRTVLWGIAAAAGFALTFAIGQAATTAGAELPVLLLTRLVAVATVTAVALISRQLSRPSLKVLPLLFLMGALDALALGAVLASGALPRPEFASVSSSLFGMITVILAWLFLKEHMTRSQWACVVLTFAGIAWLGH